MAKLFSALISLVHLGRLSETEKDLEILLLRQQISILLRNNDQLVCAARIEKLTLAVIAARLKMLTHRYASQLGEFTRLIHLRQFLVSTENWYDVSGRFHTKQNMADHGSVKKLKN